MDPLASVVIGAMIIIEGLGWYIVYLAHKEMDRCRK